ncbi:hypothetical protein BB934_28275 (plasmid) [Microvirga ossetica]|uniref:Uncharacterized protein n=1 Tax=Microvirga ossetica TaxID=1882682 RepID=A0A1B2EQH4_9HYPH|nr:hypothetical protein BB934_28275 [Microvirga ossetica]
MCLRRPKSLTGGRQKHLFSSFFMKFYTRHMVLHLKLQGSISRSHRVYDLISIWMSKNFSVDAQLHLHRSIEAEALYNHFSAEPPEFFSSIRVSKKTLELFSEPRSPRCTISESIEALFKK